MARFVRALARQTKAQLPVRSGKVREVAGRAFEAVDLLVHLPMEELDRAPRVPVREVWRTPPSAPPR